MFLPPTYDWLPTHSTDVRVLNNIVVPIFHQIAGPNLDYILAALVLFALVAGFICGGLLAYIFCRHEKAGPQELPSTAAFAGPNRWIPGIPEVMYKTKAGERIHLYDGCAGQHGIRRSDHEKYKVCAHCLSAWRKTVDAEMALYLDRHGNQRHADAGTGTRWICLCGRNRRKYD